MFVIYNLSENNWPQLQKYMGPRSSLVQITFASMWSALNKIELLFIFCIINVLPSHLAEAAEPLQPHFAPPHPEPQIRVKSKSRRLKLDQVDYWECALQIWFNKFCLKMIDHGSRSLCCPGPSRSRFLIQKCITPRTNHGCSISLVL